MKLKLTIEVEFWLYPEERISELTETEVAARVNREINDWSDGRYPFNVEMVRNGLSHIIVEGVSEVFYDRAYARHGSKMLAGKVVAPYLAEKRTRDITGRVSGNGIEVKSVVFEKDDSTP